MDSFLDVVRSVDDSWTLFLDRDGVINQEVNKNYIRSVDEFFFLPKAKEALAVFARIFSSIVVVTNQRGVELEWMTQNDLDAIHAHMEQELHQVGGRIDLILSSTSLHNDDFMRKPQTGMAHLAKEKIPSIDFTKAIMIGNLHSDMLFGKNVGMKTIFLTTTQILEPHQKKNADFVTDSLWSVARLFDNTI